MKQVTTREIQLNISSLLEDLPFEIVKHNRVVARVVVPSDDLQKQIDLLNAYVKELESRLAPQKLKDVIAVKCEHPGCKETATGQYEITVNDWERGDVKTKVYLCEFHKEKYGQKTV